MASKVASSVFKFSRGNAHRYKQGIASRIPQAWHKWRGYTKPMPKPVHWIPEEGKYRINAKTGEREIIQNIPIPVKYPKESQSALWGGEGLIVGFKKKNDNKMKPRFRKVWKPQLFQKSFYSEILDRTIGPITVTRSTVNQIDECYGFDFYILKTPKEDLKSQLGMDLKRHMLLQLVRKDTLYPDDPEKREKIYRRYQEFVIPEEEAEWVGLTLPEAVKKVRRIEQEKNPIRPLVDVYTEELVAKLKDQSLDIEGPDVDLEEDTPSRIDSVRKWLFKKKPDD
ncbi:large ribosomal subunit protein bL28m-like [Glandiceps talaboti]